MALQNEPCALLKKLWGGWRQGCCRTNLLFQHATPSPITNRSPAELLMGRKLRTTLDRLHPNYGIQQHPLRPVRDREFVTGDLVYAQNFAGAPKWIPGTIDEITGPCSYRVLLSDGRMWRCHIDQLRRRGATGNWEGEGYQPDNGRSSAACQPSHSATPNTSQALPDERSLADVPRIPSLLCGPFEVQPMAGREESPVLPPMSPVPPPMSMLAPDL